MFVSYVQISWWTACSNSLLFKIALTYDDVVVVDDDDDDVVDYVFVVDND